MRKPSLTTLAFVAGMIAPAMAVAFSVRSDESASVFEAEGFRTLDWQDLAPEMSAEAEAAAAEINMRIDQMTDAEFEAAIALIERDGQKLVADLDGEEVSLKGYLVPLDFDAERVSEFVLVPYFGACIHVPPPPPNQIAYVQFAEGIAMSELEEMMYDPFRVAGTLKVARAKTDLAEVGYQITATKMEQAPGPF